MLARVSAALLGVALFAGTACAQETTIKFTLGWKTQGSDAAFFYAKDNGRDRPGRGLGRYGHTHHVGCL